MRLPALELRSLASLPDVDRLLKHARMLAITIVSTLVLSGCWGFGASTYFPSTPGGVGANAPSGVFTTPGAQASQSLPAVAVLLPLSGQHATIGNNMNQAARMAIEDSANAGVQFAVLDTTSTVQGAANAAATALNSNANLILGPLLGSSLDQVSQMANSRGVGVIGYTNDVSRSRGGAWALGLAPEQSMERLMQWASTNGHQRVAVIAPSSPYGQAALNAARSAAARYRVSITVQQTYGPDDISKNQTAEAVALQKDLYDAVIIPDSGNALREIASLLYFYEVEPEQTKYMGLEGWDDQNLISEQSLIGGVFAVPPTDQIAQFEQRYQRRFGVMPDIKAVVVYDSMMMAAELARSAALTQQAGGGMGQRINPYSMGQLTRAQGFNGALGNFRLTTSGRVERLYEIKQLTSNGIVVLERAIDGFSVVGLPAG